MPIVTVVNGAVVGVAQPAPGVSAGGQFIPTAGDITKTGKLVHPTVGTLQYTFMPYKWSGVDGDVIVLPIWQVEQTLTGRHATMWPGTIEDALCVEFWTGLPIAMTDVLQRMYETPTDIEAGQFVVWSPEYCSDNSYKVVIEWLEARGLGPAGDPPVQHGYVQTVHGWDTKDVTIKFRIKDRA